MNRQKYIEDVCRASLSTEEILRSFRSAFYSQTFKTFEKLEVLKSISTDDGAKQYEELLHNHIELVEQHYHIPVMRRERDNYTQLLSVWSFCETLYLSKEENLFLPLMRWFNNFNKSFYFQYDKYSIYHYKTAPIFHKDFWNYAIRMAVLGQLDQIVDLLKHTLERTPGNRLTAQMDDLYKLLAGKDSIHVDQEGLSAVRAKTAKITAKNEATQIQINSLILLIDVLLGNEDAIRQNSKNDLHAFICTFFYQPAHQLSIYDAAKQYYERFSTKTTTIYEALLKQDMNEALEMCSGMDWWLLCHMSYLFDKLKEAFNQTMTVEVVKEDPFTVTIELHTRLYYASFLYNTFGLWKEAFIYMLQCGDIGKDVIKELMKAVDVSTLEDQNIDNFYQLCQQHSLQAIGYDLCMRRADFLLSLNDFQRALTYYSKANAYQQIDSVFAKIIEIYVKEGTFFDLQTCSEQFSGHHYSLYSLLWKMNQHYTQLEIEQAAEVYKKLIGLDFIPKPMIPIILWEGLKIIEGYTDRIDMKRNDVKMIKALWAQMRKANDPTQFELFHYYIQENKQQLAEPTLQTLNYCAKQFLDATSLRYSVAFAKLQNIQTRI